MKTNFLTVLEGLSRKIPEPENLFSGKRLNREFVLPDNILVFFHDYTAAAPNSHGRYTFVIPFDEMTYFLEDQALFLHPGDLLFVPPHAVRFLHPSSLGYRRFFITFELKTEQEYVPLPGISAITEEAWRELRAFLKEYQADHAPECGFHLMSFMKKLSSDSKDMSVKKGEPLPPSLLRAIAFMEQHPESVTGIKPVAEAAGLSASHLRALFRERLGLSLGQYILRKKLDFAEYRLRHSRMSLAEIAAGCGFANVYVFGAFFKRNTGIPPKRYRLMDESQKRISC